MNNIDYYENLYYQLIQRLLAEQAVLHTLLTN